MYRIQPSCLTDKELVRHTDNFLGDTVFVYTEEDAKQARAFLKALADALDKHVEKRDKAQ